MKYFLSIQTGRHIIQTLILVGVFLGILNPGTIGLYLLLSVLFFGVFYCGWICPFGSCQEFIGWLGDKLHIKKYRLPPRLQQTAVYMRYALYILGILGWITFTYNPRGGFGRFLSGNILSTLSVFLLITFCLFSLFSPRPFCNYFCEKGAQMGFLSILRLFGIKRNANMCIHCHRCTQICPMNINVEQTDFVNHPNCIGCLKCQEVCPVKCVRYTRNLKKAEQKKNNQSSVHLMIAHSNQNPNNKQV